MMTDVTDSWGSTESMGLAEDVEEKTQRSSGRIYPSVKRLGAIFALDRIKGFGPVKFRTLHEARISPESLLKDSSQLPFGGKTGEKLRIGLESVTPYDIEKSHLFAEKQIEAARKFSASILTYEDIGYPSLLYRSNNPLPILYQRGIAPDWASNRIVAIVGSREIRPPYDSLAHAFARTAVTEGLTVVSGFASGTDSIGHQTALDEGGTTVGVMPCGLDLVFPPENRFLWQSLMDYRNAVFVSEFAFGQRASSLMLRKRNKTIAALAQAVLIVQSAVDGGSMNTYRFAKEQKKPVATFSADQNQDTSGNALITSESQLKPAIFSLSKAPRRYKSWLKEVSYST